MTDKNNFCVEKYQGIFEKKLFHGTNKSFDSFELKFCGKATGAPLGFLGVYLTPSPQVASWFCRGKWDNHKSRYRKGANIVPVYVEAKSIVVINAHEWVFLSGAKKGDVIDKRLALIEAGVDAVVIRENDFLDELIVPQVAVLKPELIHFDLAGKKRPSGKPEIAYGVSFTEPRQSGNRIHP